MGSEEGSATAVGRNTDSIIMCHNGKQKQEREDSNTSVNRPKLKPLQDETEMNELMVDYEGSSFLDGSGEVEVDTDNEFFDTHYHSEEHEHQHEQGQEHEVGYSETGFDSGSSASESAATGTNILKTSSSSASLGMTRERSQGHDYESDELENINPSNNPRISSKLSSKPYEYERYRGEDIRRGHRSPRHGAYSHKHKQKKDRSRATDSTGSVGSGSGWGSVDSDTRQSEFNKAEYYSLRSKMIRSQTDLTQLSSGHLEKKGMHPSSSTTALNTSNTSSRYYPRRRNVNHNPADHALHVRKGAYTRVITPSSGGSEGGTNVFPKMKGEVEPEESEEEFYARIFNEWEEQDMLSNQPGSWYSTVLWFPVLLVLRQINLFLSITYWPTKLFAKHAFGIEMENGGGFWNVPLERKKQTTLVFSFLMMLPGIAIASFTFLILLIFPLTTIPAFIYLLFILRWDKSPWTGSRQPFMRYWKMWRHFANYFPCRLIKTHNLDPNEKYVFCYHPHGIISLGAFGNFATDATGFSRKFPGINLKLMTLEINFYVPFLRELLLWMGIVNCSKRACNTILQRGRGSSIMLVVGGAAESLESAPGTYRLNVDSRKGFVRVALDNGANLVPVLAFGENDAFSTHSFDEGSTGRWLQDEFKKRFGFATPIFYGRGFSNRQFGIMPHRTPIIAVVGKPIKVPKIPSHLHGENLRRTDEGRALVAKYHEKYIEALKALYDKYKNRWAINRCESLLLVGNKPHSA